LITMRLKTTIVILVFGYSILQAQFFVPGKKSKYSEISYENYHDGILDLIIEETDQAYYGNNIRKLSLNLETGTFENKTIFDLDFYKEHKDHKLYFCEYHNEYIVCIGKPNYKAETFSSFTRTQDGLGINSPNYRSVSRTITKIGYFIYNTIKDEYFDFLIEVEDKNTLIDLDCIIENFNEKTKELVILTEESNKDVMVFDQYDFNALYKIRRVNLETKEVTTSNLNLSEKDIVIDKVFSSKDPDHCFVRYMKKNDKTGFSYNGWNGIHYSLLDLNTGQMTPVNFQTSEKTIHGEDQIQTKDGLIIAIRLGNSSESKEVVVLGVSNKGVVTELATEVLSAKDETNTSYLEYGRSINLNGKFYRYRFEGTKFILAQMNPDKIIKDEYDLGIETSGVSMIALDDQHIEFYASNSVIAKGKKTKITYSFIKDRIDTEELDDKYDQPYIIYSYEKNGTTIPYFYKWDKTGLTIDQRIEK
jgi:hypothetical protein